jgi:hypothetical protein
VKVAKKCILILILIGMLMVDVMPVYAEASTYSYYDREKMVDTNYINKDFGSVGVILNNRVNLEIADKIAFRLGIASKPLNIQSATSVASNVVKINLGLSATTQDLGASNIKIFNPEGKEIKVIKRVFDPMDKTNKTLLITLEIDTISKSKYTLTSGTKSVKFYGKSKKENTYINSFYAISSFVDRGYTRSSDQVALGWSEVRGKDGNIYFTQRKFEENNLKQFDYGVPKSDTGDSDANITNLINNMKSKGARLKLSVFLDNSQTLRKLLSSEEMQNKVITEMTSDFRIKYFDYNNSGTAEESDSHYILDSEGESIEYDGLIIDFEGLFNTYKDEPGIEYRLKFNSFLGNLKSKLPEGKSLTVCIHPKRESPIAYYDGYDYAYIGSIAEEVILMAHDYQTKDKSIPASAPYDLVEQAIQFAVRDIPAEKILLGISINSIQWRKGSEGFISAGYADMMNSMKVTNNGNETIQVISQESRNNAKLKVGYGSLKRQVANTYVEDEFYFENRYSIEEKIEIVKRYNLKGVSIWRLGITQSKKTSENYSFEVFDPIFKFRMFDLNKDGLINHMDLEMINSYVGIKSGDPNWNRDFDFNSDSQVDNNDVSRIERFMDNKH